MAALEALLNRLDAWLKQHRPRYWRGLHPPATPAELAALEQALGRPVPEPLRELLRWHNGQSMDFVGAFVENWFLMSSERIASACCAAPADCIPFLDDDAGAYRCLAENGSLREYGNGDVVAPSLACWLERFVTDVEQGRYVEDAERGRFLRTSQ